MKGMKAVKAVKKTTLKKFHLEYVTVKNVPMETSVSGQHVIAAETLSRIERAVACAVLANAVPLRGKEVQFIRKAFGLSARALAELLGISHVAVRKWEKNAGKRLDLMNEVAVRAMLAAYIHIDMLLSDAVLRAADKPSKLEINAADVA